MSKSASFALAVLVACAYPKTPEEYREGARQGRGTSRIEKVEIQLPYRAVCANLETYASQCLNGDSRRSGIGFGRGAINKHAEGELQRLDKNKAQLSLKINGNYWLVTDVTSARPDRTTLTIYTHWKPYIDEVAGWAQGKAPGCNN